MAESPGGQGGHVIQPAAVEPGAGWENVHDPGEVSGRLFLRDTYTQRELEPARANKGVLGQGRCVNREMKNPLLVRVGGFQQGCVPLAKIQAG